MCLGGGMKLGKTRASWLNIKETSFPANWSFIKFENILKSMNSSISQLLNKYLDCEDDERLNNFDAFVNNILQNPSKSNEYAQQLKETLQLVDLKKKIKILQAIDEVLACNDLNFRNAIEQNFFQLLTEYFEHQSKTVQSDYLSQEDQYELIEFQLFVNKVLGYFGKQTQMLTLSEIRESIQPFSGIRSRPSIVVDYVDQQSFGETDEKSTQTDAEQEATKWKQKWELQMMYNQRLQKINQQLREEILRQQQQILLLSEEDQIIVNEDQSTELKKTILKKDLKPGNQSKKKVQFDSQKELVDQFDLKDILERTSSLDNDNQIKFKKACTQNNVIFFDNKKVQVLLQRVNNQITLTYLNKVSESGLEQFTVTFSGAISQKPKLHGMMLKSHQIQKQEITVPQDDFIVELELSYFLNGQKHLTKVFIPNFWFKFLSTVSFDADQFYKQWSQHLSGNQYCQLMIEIQQELDVYKIFPKAIHVQLNKYIVQFIFMNIVMYSKINYNKKSIKLLLPKSQKALGLQLLNQLFFIYK